jgi:hypothetical protein
MDTETFKRVVKRIEDVNKVVETLAPEIRAGAFEILAGYIMDGQGDHAGAKTKNIQVPRVKPGAPISMSEFFSQLDTTKPSENALSIAAYHYSLYGTEPISTSEVKGYASDVGLTIPERVGMTYQNAQRKKKKLFKSEGKGRYRPTVHGEAYFKEEFEAVKGTQKKPKDEGE